MPWGAISRIRCGIIGRICGSCSLFYFGFRLSGSLCCSLLVLRLASCVMVLHVGFARVARVRSDLEEGFLLSSRRMSSFLILHEVGDASSVSTKEQQMT